MQKQFVKELREPVGLAVVHYSCVSCVLHLGKLYNRLNYRPSGELLSC